MIIVLGTFRTSQLSIEILCQMSCNGCDNSLNSCRSSYIVPVVDELQVMKFRFSQKESLGLKLLMKISVGDYEYNNQITPNDLCEADVQKAQTCYLKPGLKRSLQSTDIFDYHVFETLTGDNSKDIDEEVAKEWEHTILQDSLARS